MRTSVMRLWLLTFLFIPLAREGSRADATWLGPAEPGDGWCAGDVRGVRVVRSCPTTGPAARWWLGDAERVALGAPLCWWTADAAMLATLPGVGERVGERLVAWRGGWRGPERVDEVPGVGASLAARIRAGVETACGPGWGDGAVVR